MLLALAAAVGLQAGAPDSAAVHRSARAAQAEFERERRAHLPFTHPGGGRYEERIGRFRFWHDDGEAPPKPPPESPRVHAARERLLARLDSAAAVLPGDGWIAGQQVRYLVEHGAADRAALAAARCAAAAWWCRALEGLARHAAGDFAAAEDAFDAALADMPADERCRWTDASLLLEGAFGARYRRLPCADRAALDERIWWLARPLYSLPGNDRRTEHLARVTMTAIQRDARNAYGLRWGADMAEITVRYGWVTGWSAESPRYGGGAELAVVGYHRVPAFHFLPTAAALSEPSAATARAWDLRPPAPRTLYAPVYADSLVSLPHQVAAFRRGDSTLVLAAYDLSRDAGFSDRPVEVGLALSDGPRGDPVIARSQRPRGALAATIGPGAVLFALEALSRDARRAARARYALAAPAAAGVAISDLLLLAAADTLPTQLYQALEHVLPSADLGARRRVVVFWEAYGLNPAGEPVEITLSVRRTGAGLFRRAARAVGLAGKAEPVRIAWRESPWSTGGVAGRALLLDLSALRPGSYRIELVVEATPQGPVTATRDVRLGPSGERASRE